MAYQSSFSSVPQLVANLTAPVTQIANATIVDRTIAVTGLTPDMICVINYPNLDTGLAIINVSCDTAGTLKIRFYNPTGSPITPAAATIYLKAL